MSDPLTELAQRVGQALQVMGATLATAESCTGGGVAEAVTRIAGSSAWFERGWITYSNLAKYEELGVDQALIAAHGAVSGAVAGVMAEGARVRSASTWAIAVSGIAGPGGGSPEKPVGTVWLGWAGPRGSVVECCFFRGDRRDIRHAAVERALAGLLEQIELAAA